MSFYGIQTSVLFGGFFFVFCFFVIALCKSVLNCSWICGNNCNIQQNCLHVRSSWQGDAAHVFRQKNNGCLRQNDSRDECKILGAHTQKKTLRSFKWLFPKCLWLSVSHNVSLGGWVKNGGTLREAVSGRLEGLETLNSPEGTVPRWRTSTDKSLTLIGKRKKKKMFGASQNNNLLSPSCR